jgi:hypothetical protein
MKEESIAIRQIANPDNPNVGAKYVNTKEYLTPRVGRDGKVITGVDENSLDIINLPADEMKEKQKEMKKKRESLEKLLGKDLSPSSSFWYDFYVVLEDEMTLDPTNPMDQLIEMFLVANGYVAPSEDDITNDDRYHGAVFYVYREQQVVAKKAKNNQEIDAATAKLFSMYEQNPQKLKMVVSYIFGLDADIELSVESAYEKLRDFISHEEDQKKNIQTFLSVSKKSPEEIMIKITLDKAIKKKLVKAVGGKIKRGEEIYGSSREEALMFLSLAENSGELAHLRKELED